MTKFSHLSVNGSVMETYPFANEASMEGYLWDNPSALALRDDDYVKIHNLQVQWAGDIKDGRLDILAEYNGKTAAIVELKNGDLSQTSFDQLNDYFKNYDYKANSSKQNLNLGDWIGVLVGSGIEESFEKELPSLKLHDSIPLYVILLHRFKSDSQIMVVADVIKKDTIWDKRKWSLNGEGSYSRGTVVFNFIKKFVEKNRDKSKEYIVDLFKKHKAASGSGKTCILRECLKDDDYYDYYFTKSCDWVVFINGVSYALYHTFDKDQWEGVLEVAKEMGFEIKEV